MTPSYWLTPGSPGALAPLALHIGTTKVAMRLHPAAGVGALLRA